MKTLHTKIGSLTLENDFFVRRAPHCAVTATGSREPRRSLLPCAKMIDRTTKLSVSRKALVLGIGRSSVYYKARPVSDADLS